jgi:hypothetical protein
MKDIIFHIGFPKCASTTLQNKVLKMNQLSKWSLSQLLVRHK